MSQGTNTATGLPIEISKTNIDVMLKQKKVLNLSAEDLYLEAAYLLPFL